MNEFLGTPFFSDTKFLKKRTFLTKKYELPLMIRKRLHVTAPIHEKNFIQFLDNSLKTSANYYNCDKFHKVSRNFSKKHLNNNFIPTKIQQFPDNAFNDTPAPNRYSPIFHDDIANTTQKQTGTKGPYACFTGERNDTTIIGHLQAKKFHGSKTMFYNLPSEIDKLNHPRKYFAMKFRPGSRFNQKSFSRFMLNDLTLCEKNPDAPGPANYFPDNFSIKKLPPLKVKHEIHKNFQQGSIVPQSKRFMYRASDAPGPGRYFPHEIACPCKSGHSYDSEKIHKFEKARRQYFYDRTKKYQTPQLKSCDPPNIRNIPYHGNTSVFKSKVMRLISKTNYIPNASGAEKSRFERPMELDANYIHMVKHPKRNVISYPAIDFTPQPTRDIHFFSIERPAKRTKLRSNKRVGFMSGCQRFKHLTAIAKEDFERKISKNIKNLEPYEVKIPDVKTRMKVLQKLPPRLELLRNVKEKTDKFNSFEPIPQGIILVDDNLFEANKSLEKINNNLKFDIFLKDEYISN